MTNNDAVMRVVNPGMLTIPVDQGRSGTHCVGLTSGGAMDQVSFHLANRLCGNAPGTTCFEITYGGLEVDVLDTCKIAVTGAEMPVSVNQKMMPRWQTLLLNQGDRLQIGQASKGIRGYLAIAGGFQVQQQFGSSSAIPREFLGGTHQNGSGVKPEEILFRESRKESSQEGPVLRVSESDIPDFPEHVTLRVVPGYQIESFERVDLVRFFSSDYCVTQRMDRMGVRLQGKAISSNLAAMRSEGIAYGAIQVPPDGQPIIMLNDRQTIGGYPKLGSVLSLDCFKLAQAAPGTRIRFCQIDMFTAHNALLLEAQKQNRLELTNL